MPVGYRNLPHPKEDTDYVEEEQEESEAKDVERHGFYPWHRKSGTLQERGNPPTVEGNPQSSLNREENVTR
jgi:hypothetical protein